MSQRASTQCASGRYAPRVDVSGGVDISVGPSLLVCLFGCLGMGIQRARLWLFMEFACLACTCLAVYWICVFAGLEFLGARI